MKLVQLQFLAIKSLLCYTSEVIHTYIHTETHTFSMTENILNHLKKMQVDGGIEALNFLRLC